MSSSTGQNPLLAVEFQIPFDRIRSEDVEPAVDQLIAAARAEIDRLAASQEPRTFENTLLALERITENLEFAIGVAGHLESVATTPELRAAYNAAQPKVSEFFSSIPLNAGVWKQIKAYAETPEARELSGVRARFLQKTMDSFRRSGAELDDAGKKRLQEINVELTRLTTKFSENVLDSTNSFELYIEDEHELSGLPPSAREAARESARSKGREGWRFTLQGPSYIAAMTYLDARHIREQLYRAYNTRATKDPYDNRGLIPSILALRLEKAQMLGYRDFSDLVLEDRMARRGAEAEKFVQTLREKTEHAFVEENKELLEFMFSRTGDRFAAMEAWDVAYWAEKLRQERYEFDEEELRPYFPFPRVVEGMFELVRRLYGITVREEKDVPAWDPAVTFYSIHDADSALLGGFYADFYPRENKRGGAWMDSLITGHPPGGKPHLGVICGNVTPPVGNKPALLTHREVETLFHEFGHLLHHLLSRVEIRSLAGTHVAWDFVELPSQIMENWCWEREALNLFARHYETGEPIPQDLFEKMKRARTFRSANAQMRQLGFATLDLSLHRHYSVKPEGDVIEYAYKILNGFAPVDLPRGYAMAAAFTHLFSDPVGYGAGYYSYKWSEVLDADAFTRFAQEGVFSSDAGRDFREKILARGDSEDPAALFRSFLGRDPRPDALLERLGLARASS